ncbi:JmjC domain-containing protein [Acidihalobacter prosperus]
MSNNLLGGLTAQAFLNDYWQRRPLLVRQAIDNIQTPIGAEELAGLSLESDVPSRLVIQHDENDWNLRHGPFEEADFFNLPESHWTLLITDMEKFVPKLHELVAQFRFLPDWRIDDLMISYASPQGSVGPHCDAYDVFLLQLEGTRRWQINTDPSLPKDIVPDLDLRILARFEPESEWVLEPGDMLYLPPGVAHYGVAIEAGMTASIGFRAPSQYELVTAWLDDIAARIDPEQRFSDPGRHMTVNPGEIDYASRRSIIRLLKEALQVEDEKLERWFGRYITEPRADLVSLYSDDNDWTEERLKQHLSDGHGLVRNTAARLAYFSQGQQLLLYADGVEYTFDMNFQWLIGVLCQRYSYPAELCYELLDSHPRATHLVIKLLQRSILEPAE